MRCNRSILFNQSLSYLQCFPANVRYLILLQSILGNIHQVSNTSTSTILHHNLPIHRKPVVSYSCITRNRNKKLTNSPLSKTYPKILFSLVAPQVPNNIRMTALLQHLDFTANLFIPLLLKPTTALHSQNSNQLPNQK